MSTKKKPIDITLEDGFRYTVVEGVVTFVVTVITPKGNKLFSWSFTQNAGIAEANRLIREVKEGSHKGK